MTTHKIHPKCSSCGRALHRSLKVRVRVREGPQIYCRNTKCKLFKKKQKEVKTLEESNVNSVDNETELTDITQVHELDENIKIEKPIKAKEPNKIENARKDVQKMLNFTDVKVQSFMVTLVLIAQEIGEKELANKLIVRFSLEKYFEN